MFLHREKADRVSSYAKQVVEQVLYLLWDIGFKVWHSTRSIAEALEQAKSDMLTKTAMLESRFIAGDREIERLFREEFRTKCVQGHEREYVELRMRDQAARHAKHGNSVYMQEPHVKSGCGGLRDYQNLLWMTFFREGALTTTHLVARDWLSLADQRRIDVAYDFLLRLRTELHYLDGRATDVLRLNLQETIAERLQYPRQGRALLSEALMKDYYEHTRNIFRVTERITEHFASGRSANGTGSFFFHSMGARGDEKEVGECVIRDLPPNLPAGWPVEVTYKYTEDGLLKVKAELVGHGAATSSDFVRDNNLPDDDLLLWAQMLEAVNDQG
jgi:[protein-PII] uridylyltransferase